MPKVKTITKTKKAVIKPKKISKTEKNYFQAVGRRKTAVARIRLFTKGDKEITINDKPLASYFPSAELQQIVKDPLENFDILSDYSVNIKVKGSGVHAQAEACRHGITRALVSFDEESRKKFKKTGFLTRDARERERKKPGLKRARRAPQWRKR